ncbi:MAG: histidine phosphotransferase family protein [Pseudomonadota bacterium]
MTSTSNTLLLNDLIGSRICHDLISPLGAIGNGVELLSMSGVSAVPEITLIAESVENANARIRFFRIAFGAASHDAIIGNSEVRRVLSDLYRGNRISVDWRLVEDTRRIEAKLAFLILQCFESALPWGGKVAVTRNGETWSIFGTSERLKVENELWDLLPKSPRMPDVSPSNVHFALVAPTAEIAGRQVRTSFNGNAISVSF